MECNNDFLLKVSKPSRYMGHEINSIKKNKSYVDVSLILAFPDVYEVGMSHQGLKILYSILNSQPWIAAERVFCPWPDMEDETRKNGLLLSSLESDKPLINFDVVGFSVQHELCYSNILTMLDLAGIPFLSSDRDESFPLIVAGGPACFNPEPIADIFDAVLIGDGEKATVKMCEIIRDGKKEGKNKDEILSALKMVRGFYIPSFFKPKYNDNKYLAFIEPLVDGYETVEKAVIGDMSESPFPVNQVIPFTQLVHDRLAIEISRGCTRGCRFCQAGMIYRPVRERNPDDIIELTERSLKLTGFGEMALLSLSTGDYSCIAPLLKELMDRQADRKVAVSLPSLRIDSIDPFWFEQIKRVRKTGFTMAPEAGTDRLRRIINKTLTNEEIIKTAGNVYAAGWKLIKLYFMIGLPGETEDDIYGIIDLAKKVASTHRGKGKKDVLNISVSTFVPKAHTPFMWEPQLEYEESRRRINIIRDGLRGSHVKVKWNQPELSWLEGVFSRGDRKLTSSLISAWKSGARFDAWGEHYNMGLWKDSFKKSGIDPRTYLHRRRSLNEKMAWGHISSGVTTGYLKKEYQNACEETMTPDCRSKCLKCGVCDFKSIKPQINTEWSPPEKDDGKENEPESQQEKRRFRLFFSKKGPAKYLSHLELVKLLIRALRRTGLDIVFSEGYHPMPKLSFACALPVGTESICETANIELYGPVSPEALKEKLSFRLPDGINLSDVKDITGSGKSVAIKETHYHIDVSGLKINKKDLDSFINIDYFGVVKKTKKGEKEIDAKKTVKSIGFNSDMNIEMVFAHTGGPELKPAQIIAEIFKIDADNLDMIKVLKVRQVTD